MSLKFTLIMVVGCASKRLSTSAETEYHETMYSFCKVTFTTKSCQNEEELALLSNLHWQPQEVSFRDMYIVA